MVLNKQKFTSKNWKSDNLYISECTLSSLALSRAPRLRLPRQPHDYTEGEFASILFQMSINGLWIDSGMTKDKERYKKLKRFFILFVFSILSVCMVNNQMTFFQFIILFLIFFYPVCVSLTRLKLLLQEWIRDMYCIGNLFLPVNSMVF